MAAQPSALHDALTAVRRRWGLHSIVQLGAYHARQVTEGDAAHTLPSWWPTPDKTAQPQLAELVGPESGGKLTLALLWLAQLPSNGPLIFIDPTGQAYPPAIAACGIDARRLAIVQPPRARDLLRVVLELTRSEGFDAVITCLDPHATVSLAEASQLRSFVRSAQTTVLLLRTSADARNDTAALPLAETRVRITNHNWLWDSGELTGLQVQVRTERSLHKLSGDEHALTFRLYRRGIHGARPNHLFVDTAIRTHGHHTLEATGG